mmetsp:Transcript_16785/g.23083  ORF Transcript_16785/g.23083 Transcript_16785/m.23083 type:complete len:268 (+) Transcript_16785:6-809(+)
MGMLVFKIVFITVLTSAYYLKSLRAFQSSIKILNHRIAKGVFKRYKCTKVSVRCTRLKLKEDDFDEDFEEKLLQKLGRVPLRPNNKEEAKPPPTPVLFSGVNKWQTVNRALFAGVFVAGIGLGITLDSAINTNPKDLASRDAIDRNAPNPKLCATYGSSAMVLDQRVFVTFNPFNVYVTQADTKPGCVLRSANVINLLQVQRKLVTNEDMENCKNSFNTWGFVGDIDSTPQISCVYQSDDAQNEFLSNPKVGLGEDVYDKNGLKISK